MLKVTCFVLTEVIHFLCNLYCNRVYTSQGLVLLKQIIFIEIFALYFLLVSVWGRTTC